MSYRINWEIQAVDLTAGFLSDDPAGVAALWDHVSELADEPRPPESFPYGSPDLRRLRAGRYRVFYKIDDDSQIIQVDHVGLSRSRASPPWAERELYPNMSRQTDHAVSAGALPGILDSERVDLIIADVRMPATFTNEGLVAAIEAAARIPACRCSYSAKARPHIAAT